MRKRMEHDRADLAQVRLFQEDPDAFASFLDENRVSRCGLVNYVAPDLMGFTWHANEFAAAYRNSHPDRFFAYGSVHPRLSKDPKAEMTKLISKLKVDAIKIHPPHQLAHANGYIDGSAPALRTIYAMAQDAGLPVTIHTGTSVFPGARNRFGDPIFTDDVAIDFPDLKIVLAHGGRPLWTKTAFFLVRRHPNVFLDLSGIPPGQLLESFPRLEEIAPRCMFGSDWPGPGVRSIRANAEAVAALPLSASALDHIFRKTAARVFPA
ncbi:MAG TPA: amidohydrolase family protein [Candidatus Thermoplasmatota archaeon]|nr:amidohydrolase family protein [Candidatus Thermoplasmatota archaeon]